MLLRQDPPFDMAYITTTHLLERIHPKTLVVNDPAQRAQRAREGVRARLPRPDAADAGHAQPRRREGASAPSTRTSSSSRSTATAAPPCSASAPGDTNLNSLVELFQTVFREPFMVQQYRPEVRAGDKRIILVDGEVAGAINRVPAADETRSNLHVGGIAAADRADRARPRDLRAARARAEEARAAVHRHRRDRPLPHRDQRHLAHRHPPGEGLRRRPTSPR